MSAGFGGDPNQGRIGKDAKITIDLDNIDIVLKQYKKIKKYQKSSLYAIKSMDGTEDIVSSLIKEAEENPL
jgi:N-acetylglutamate synthase/N-acetylornithine aminotransferase